MSNGNWKSNERELRQFWEEASENNKVEYFCESHEDDMSFYVASRISYKRRKDARSTWSNIQDAK